MLTKCNQCGEIKTAKHFERASRRADGYCRRPGRMCLICSRVYRKNLLQRVRKQVLFHYSNGKIKCACCGIKHLEFLAIDHINGGGSKHRKSLKSRNSFVLYRWLIKNQFPPGFRVLCHNCNYAVHFYKTCPHARSKHA